MNLTIPEEFPISEKERQLIKKKLLIFLAWCKGRDNKELWKANGYICPQDCPFKEFCSPVSGSTDHLQHLINWIMEAEI